MPEHREAQRFPNESYDDFVERVSREQMGEKPRERPLVLRFPLASHEPDDPNETTAH